MGIQGLLPLLKSITRAVHVSEYKGERVAIDGYCWLHRGVYSCSFEIAENIFTDKYVQYFMNRVRLLRHHEVIPVIVFDGGKLPAKAAEEADRKREREKNRAKGLALLQAGNRSGAAECFSRAVDVTPFMAYRIIKELKKENIEYLVAPYEADAQLTFLCLKDYVSAVITEDSDLIAYGCKKILFKMDKDGNGQEIQLKNLGANEDLSFMHWTPDMFLFMCVLSGCDFLPSLSGMGLKTAHKFVKEGRTIENVLRRIRLSGNFFVPPAYDENFRRAVYTFRHQRVFDPETRLLSYLRPPPEELVLECHDFLGPDVDNGILRQVAEGRVDPITKLPFEDEKVEDAVQKPSQQLPEKTSMKFKMARILPKAKNTLMSYFTPASKGAAKPFIRPRGSSHSTESHKPSHLTSDDSPAEVELVTCNPFISYVSGTSSVSSQCRNETNHTERHIPVETALLSSSYFASSRPSVAIKRPAPEDSTSGVSQANVPATDGLAKKQQEPVPLAYTDDSNVPGSCQPTFSGRSTLFSRMSSAERTTGFFAPRPSSPSNGSSSEFFNFIRGMKCPRGDSRLISHPILSHSS